MGFSACLLCEYACRLWSLMLTSTSMVFSVTNLVLASNMVQFHKYQFGQEILCKPGLEI